MNGGTGRPHITLAEAEDLVERIVGVPDTIEELMLSFDIDLPPYAEGMRAIVAGVEMMKEAEESDPESHDCWNPACFRRPQHQSYLKETVLEFMPELEEKIDRMKKELSIFLFKYQNCECSHCETKDKKDAAKFN